MHKLEVFVITLAYFTKEICAVVDNILNYFCVRSWVAEMEKLSMWFGSFRKLFQNISDFKPTEVASFSSQKWF